MKIYERSIGKEEVELTETNGEIVISSGEAFFIIREVSPERLVIMCPEPQGLEIGGTIYRMFIEPVSGKSFQLTQWVINPKDKNAES